ncbi:MAG: hypothetical protein EHM39_14250 [Chloroflexi bacterium]|nr:MAG: hypothetical protein EHM39_14250 [Chloroflexota bacterium]
MDAVRIGRDVGVKWAGEQSAQSLLAALMLRNFANPILWQADPDCVLLRSRFHHLTDDEIRSLALYAGMSGGVLMTSDALHELPPERVELLRLLQVMDAGECRYPLLGQTDPPDPVVAQVREAVPHAGEMLIAVHLFNTGDEAVSRRYSLGDLGIAGPVAWWGAASGAAEAAATAISVSLRPHESKLLWLKIG